MCPLNLLTVFLCFSIPRLSAITAPGDRACEANNPFVLFNTNPVFNLISYLLSPSYVPYDWLCPYDVALDHDCNSNYLSTI